ncbi:MAG TPA: exodeoxyribonuclease VII large subunit, partial [Deltaproteobacteria bacterium]|nr:exodeoxyribonuclease VII large subunit [Deltaproteobacteria bacterium]
MPIAGSEPVHTVSDLALRVKRSLDGAFDAVWVKGEISNFRAYSSGHWYFTL